MKNSNVARITDTIEDMRRWLKCKLPPETPRNEIEDLVQGVCLIAVTKLGEIPEDLGEARVKAWLRRACEFATRKHKSAWRVALGRFGNSDPWEIELPYQRKPPTEEHLLRALRRIEPRLTRQQRSVLVMLLDGRSCQEIAGELRISPATVSQRKKEITALLREQDEDGYCGIVPPSVVRAQQASPVAWTAGIVGIVAVILWFVGADGDGRAIFEPSMAAPTPPEDLPDRFRGGVDTRPSNPSPPLVSSADIVPPPVVEKTTEPRTSVRDANLENIAEPEPVRRRHRQRPPAYLAHGAKATPLVSAIDITSSEPRETLSLALQEIELFRDARTSFLGGAHEDALTLIHEHETRFPTSDMAMDRKRLEISVLCALGRIEDATIVESVLKTYQDPGPLLCMAP